MDLNMLIERRAPFIPVSRLFNRMVKDLDLEIIAGYQGLERPIFSTDVNRPGLALTGYLDYFANDRVQILGNTEIHFMERLTPSELSARLSQIFSFEVPVFVLSRRLTPQPIFMDWCNRNGVPVMRSALSTVEVISRIILFLNEEFAPETDIHGTAIDVYGVGCLLIGPPGIGKSEAALELVERGHRLVADDQVTSNAGGQIIFMRLSIRVSGTIWKSAGWASLTSSPYTVSGESGISSGSACWCSWRCGMRRRTMIARGLMKPTRKF